MTAPYRMSVSPNPSNAGDTVTITCDLNTPPPPATPPIDLTIYWQPGGGEYTKKTLTAKDFDADGKASFDVIISQQWEGGLVVDGTAQSGDAVITINP